MRDEAEPKTSPERLPSRGALERDDLWHEAEERERPDSESDPGEEVQDAREGRQGEGSQEPHLGRAVYHDVVRPSAWPCCSTRPRIFASASTCWGGSRTA